MSDILYSHVKVGDKLVDMCILTTTCTVQPVSVTLSVCEFVPCYSFGCDRNYVERAMRKDRIIKAPPV